MTALELIAKLQSMVEINPRNGEKEIVIPIHIHGAQGGTPNVKVTGLYQGFDWDKGLIFLNPEKDLTLCQL
jgi:hypothetical protein